MSTKADFQLIGFESSHPFHAYILAGPPQYWQPSLDQIIKQLKIDRLDLWLMVDEPVTNIDLIRRIEKIVVQKPFSSPHKLVVINGLTISHQATHALLKTIEEPTGKSIIVIATKPDYDLPPTITSRCQLIKIRAPIGLGGRSGPGGVDGWLTIRQIQKLDIIDRLEYIESFLKKDQRVSDMLDFWLNDLYASDDYQTEPALATNLLVAKQRVAQNVQPRLVLEFLMLKL